MIGGSRRRNHMSKLLVLWRPARKPVPETATVLSFLSPMEEERLAAVPGLKLIRGRQILDTVKPTALWLQAELVARIGVIGVAKELTLRQAMARPDRPSRWWYHQLSIRDSESRPFFGWIAQTLAVRKVMREEGLEGLSLVGAPPGAAQVLGSVATVETTDSERPVLGWINVISSLASRFAFMVRQIWYRWEIGRHYQSSNRLFDLVFSGFWDWSFGWNEKERRYDDRYFCRLPSLLAAQKVRSGYFAWFDPHYQTEQRGRSAAQVLQPLQGRDEVVLLQYHLRYRDIVRAALDFVPWRHARVAHVVLVKKQLLREDGLDWSPMFGPVLMQGCLGAQIPNFELVALATERATRKHCPRLTLSFLEHFPHARAHYAGVKRAGVRTENWAMQHASVCREKTFFYLNPRVEFLGEPDGCRVPTPERMFVMGTLSRELFLACGYDTGQIAMTGSARFDHIRAARTRSKQMATGPRHELNVLLACTLEIDTEIALVEAAFLAARASPGLTLRLRNHPSHRVDEHPRFAACRGGVEISANSLAEDLSWADLILFSHSTVANEAFLQGVPVWQWLPLRFNGSALTEVLPIPRFGSVPDLRRGFLAALEAGGPSPPSASDRDAATSALFAPGDGRAAERIADAVLDQLYSRSSSVMVSSH
jgi:hypothetical protein